MLEQFGRTAPGVQAIFKRILHHRLQILVRQGTLFSFAKKIASSELWGPISCQVARCSEEPGRLMLSVLPESADLGDTLNSLPPSSPGESQ